MARTTLLLLALLLGACSGSALPSSDTELARQVGQLLFQSCPQGALDDEAARSACSGKLTEAALLREGMANPFLWGGQQEAGVLDLGSHVTRFHPLVWRRLYLSLYTFTDSGHVETLGDGRTVLTIGVRFRNKLDMGSYPYPFWHRLSKWTSYQTQNSLQFIVEKGQLTGALRSLEVTAELADVQHEWAGQWTWTVGDEQLPYVVLYKYLFTSTNPHVEALDAAYRDLEHQMRRNTCHVCHSPDNVTAMNQLELFNYPNQALEGRQRIVQTLEGVSPYPMPKADQPRGMTADLPDDERATLLGLAKEFAKQGDLALAWEGEK